MKLSSVYCFRYKFQMANFYRITKLSEIFMVHKIILCLNLDDAFHINYIQPQRKLIYYAMESILAKTFSKDCSTSDYDPNRQILILGYVTSSL